VSESLGLIVWTTDQAGPFQTRPYLGSSWRPETDPKQLPHEYVKNGIAKLMTLFHPTTGEVRVKGVRSCRNSVLHPWLKQELTDILSTLPTPAEILGPEVNRTLWNRWFDGLSEHALLPDELPPLRGLLIMDNWVGHKTPDFVQWLFEQGIIPLYTPLGGSWLNPSNAFCNDGPWMDNTRRHPRRSSISSRQRPEAGTVILRHSSGVVNGPRAVNVAASVATHWVVLALVRSVLSAACKPRPRNGYPQTK
jgi:hypothetical protein